MVHSSIDIDDDLMTAAKDIGGHGILRAVCIESLKELVLRGGEPEVLPLAARQNIAAVRERIETARNEERIIHDCWEEYVKVRFAPIVSRYGLRKKTLEPLIEEAKMWLFEKYGRLPTDDEIATRFKEYYASERRYWGEERAKTFRSALMSEVNEPGIAYRANGETHV
ncbi:MAG: hypothetical protein WCT23_09940 [Candidatus Neomarinimicrobiota bacterium]